MTGVAQFLQGGTQPDQGTKTPWNVSDSSPFPVATIGASNLVQQLVIISPVVNISGFLFATTSTSNPRHGARIINWLTVPIFIAPSQPSGLPGPDPVPGGAFPGGDAQLVYADFVPPYNSTTNVPGQYNFCFAPQNQWFYLVTGTFSAGDSFNVLTW